MISFFYRSSWSEATFHLSPATTAQYQMWLLVHHDSREKKFLPHPLVKQAPRFVPKNICASLLHRRSVLDTFLSVEILTRVDVSEMPRMQCRWRGGPGAQAGGLQVACSRLPSARPQHLFLPHSASKPRLARPHNVTFGFNGKGTCPSRTSPSSSCGRAAK